MRKQWGASSPDSDEQGSVSVKSSSAHCNSHSKLFSYMPGSVYKLPVLCVRRLRNLEPLRSLPTSLHVPRHISWQSPLRQTSPSQPNHEETNPNFVKVRSLPSEEDTRTEATLGQQDPSEQGAMSQRLSEATEEALLTGGRAGRKAISEAGFSEEMKQKLLDRIETAKFKSEHVNAYAEVNSKGNVGKGSRDLAAGAVWSGEEQTSDAVLRMLDDSNKPLPPGLRRKRSKMALPVVDLRLKGQPVQKAGVRLANARDKSSVYASIRDGNMSEEEREAMRQELKDRFSPGAGAMPNTIRGLAALANERIEDAIARGQFKNIPRGKAIERDARADNPFLDTTEYIMNKMIQRQEIVPPWIEKQQELVKATSVFRTRLRNDWKRQAARTIASRGGSLQEQMRAAERYAEAERAMNTKKRPAAQGIVATATTDDPVMIKVVEEATPDSTPLTAHSSSAAAIGERDITQTPIVDLPSTAPGKTLAFAEPDSSDSRSPVFRIPSWVESESSYLNLSISNLNSITRSYNLMAPDLAKKPYFSLERELKACYADVAPALAEEISERARRPPKKDLAASGDGSGRFKSLWNGRLAGPRVAVHQASRPAYGFKEWWHDVRPWGKRGGEL